MAGVEPVLNLPSPHTHLEKPHLTTLEGYATPVPPHAPGGTSCKEVADSKGSPIFKERFFEVRRVLLSFPHDEGFSPHITLTAIASVPPIEGAQVPQPG